MNFKNSITPALLFATIALSTSFTFAAAPSTQSTTSATETQSTIALEGYSAVSYLDKQLAEKGSDKYSTEYNGKVYQFVDQAQRDAFLANPNKYTPAFDGYCAYGIAKNAKYPVNPTTFKIVGGRTFLFLNNEEINTLELWNQENEQVNTRAANINWEAISGEGVLNHYNLPAGDNLGIQGYSPVAYFTQNKAVKGSPEHTANYRGVRYQFSSPEELELFKKNPSKYEPAYGGWCATGMVLEKKFEINPSTFKIVENRLFLFKNDEQADALKLWNDGNEAEEVVKADNYWTALIGE